MADTAARTVDAPPRVWSTTAQAAEWLGLTEPQFEAVAGAEAGWMEPAYTGRGNKGKRWYWMDLVCLSWLYRARGGRTARPRRPAPTPESEAEESEES
jgi:hypothetical protein